MIEFMFAVLASNVFWGIYAVASLIAAITMMRLWGKKELAVLTGKREDGHDNMDSTLGTAMFVVFFILWPIIAVVAAVKYLAIIIGKLLVGGLKVVLTTTDKVVPNFEVKVNREEPASEKD